MDIKTLCRPVNSSGKRLAPHLLSEHCKSHQIPRPRCLCLIDQSSGNPFAGNIGEAIFVQTIISPHFGEYVAKCVCGYFGECKHQRQPSLAEHTLVPLERIFRRTKSQNHAAPKVNSNFPQKRGLKRTYAMLGKFTPDL